MYGNLIYTGRVSGLLVPMDTYNLADNNFSAESFNIHGIQMNISVDNIVKTPNAYYSITYTILPKKHMPAEEALECYQWKYRN